MGIQVGQVDSPVLLQLVARRECQNILFPGNKPRFDPAGVVLKESHVADLQRAGIKPVQLLGRRDFFQH